MFVYIRIPPKGNWKHPYKIYLNDNFLFLIWSSNVYFYKENGYHHNVVIGQKASKYMDKLNLFSKKKIDFILVMERTWVRVRNVRLFWSSSSFSSSFGLISQVRDVQSSVNFLNFYSALFKDILGQRSCEIILKYFPPHFGSRKSWLTLENKTKIMAKFEWTDNWKIYFQNFLFKYLKIMIYSSL